MPEPRTYRAEWVVPVASAPVHDGALVVDGRGRITAMGPAESVERGATETLDLGRAAILPGLVNVHAHPELTIFRGSLEGLEFGNWIEELKDLKYSVGDDETLRVSTWLGVAEAIAGGITCLAAPDDAGYLMEALREIGVRGVVYREVFGPDPQQSDSALRGLGEKVATMRRFESDRVRVGVSPHAPYTVSRPLFRRVAEYAAAEELPVCVHVAESVAEVRFVRDGRGPFARRLRARGIDVEATGRSPVAWLRETGILETRPLLVHCVHVEPADIDIIRDAGAAVAHCPVSNAKLGHGVAPLDAFLKAGIEVGLGSDSVASNDRIDILEEARFSFLVRAALSRRTDALSTDRMLELATVGGARAVGLHSRIGTLEVGKDADFVAVRLDRPHTTPIGDPVAALLHSAVRDDVFLNVVEGRVIYRDGAFETLDWPALLEAGRQAARFVRGRRVGDRTRNTSRARRFLWWTHSQIQ